MVNDLITIFHMLRNDIMKKNKKDIFIFSLITIFFLIIIFIAKNREFNLVISTTFILIITVVLYALFGIKKDITTLLDKKTINILLIYSLIYYIIIYSVGLIIGYKSNSLIVKNHVNIFFYYLSILFTELIRYIVINKDKKSQCNIIVITILLLIINILNLNNLFKLNIVMYFTIIFYNIFLTNLSYYFGYKIVLVYRFLMEGLIIVIPIVPKLSLSILALLIITFIILLYLALMRSYNYYNHIIYKKKFVTKRYRLIYIPFCLIFLSILVLVSKDYDIYLMAIASNSMSPKLNRGDAIIVKKVTNDKDISPSDIIVFKHNNKNVVHRVINVIERNHKKYYQTKGDNNNNIDDIYLKINEVEGKVYLKIPYLAYPTIKIREVINKGKEG